jgi:hypothetical protein
MLRRDAKIEKFETDNEILKANEYAVATSDLANDTKKHTYLQISWDYPFKFAQRQGQCVNFCLKKNRYPAITVWNRGENLSG